MLIGSRLFPYPVLNINQINSSYKPEYTFQLKYNLDRSENNDLILRGAHCELNSPFLKSLINEGKAKIILVYECPETLYRDTFELTLKSEGEDILINGSFLGIVCSATALIVATEDIVIEGNVDDFVDEYIGLEIHIDKHDILAVDETNRDRLNFNVEDDIKKGTIFSIVPSESARDGQMIINSDNHIISILLSPEVVDSYRTTSPYTELNNLYFSILAVPALSQCINKSIQSDEASAAEMIEYLSINNDWFAAFCLAYKNKYNKDFEVSDLDQVDDIVQNLFDYPIGRSILYIENTMIDGGNGNED